MRCLKNLMPTAFIRVLYLYITKLYKYIYVSISAIVNYRLNFHDGFVYLSE
jgi:hypothetical protein